MREIKLTEEEAKLIKMLVNNYGKAIAISQTSDFSMMEYDKIRTILNKLS